MIKHIYRIGLLATLVTFAKGMDVEQATPAHWIDCSLVKLLEESNVALGGAQKAIDQTEMLALHDQFIALKQVMLAVIEGMDIKDDQLILSAPASEVPLSRACDWVQAAFDLAEKKHYENTEFVTSADYIIRDCQMMHKKLWQFGICTDLKELNPESAVPLYINRMIRIGALLNYNNPLMQNLALLKEFAKAQVAYIRPAPCPVIPTYQHLDIHTQFMQSEMMLPVSTKNKKKCTGCFTRRLTKDGLNKKSK